MARHAARVDGNHGAVVEALRKAGATVQSLATIGNGCPDLLVFYRGLYLLEVKDGNKPPSARSLTPDQVEWIKAWGGPVFVVESPAHALTVIGAIK